MIRNPESYVNILQKTMSGESRVWRKPQHSDTWHLQDALQSGMEAGGWVPEKQCI